MAVSATVRLDRAGTPGNAPSAAESVAAPVHRLRRSADDVVEAGNAAERAATRADLELLRADRAFRLRDGTVLNVPQTRDTLRYGSTDEDGVKTLQSLLVATGATLELNGEFDRETQRTLTHFQRDNALVTTGVADAATWRALVYSVFPESFMVASADAPIAIPGDTVSEPLPSDALPAATVDFSGLGDPLLRRDARGPEVERLQRALQHLGFSIESDGVFGPGTAQTVRDFQSRFNAAGTPTQIDGVVGRGTGEAIAGAVSWQAEQGRLWAEAHRAGAQLPTEGRPPIQRSVGPGGANRRGDVRLLQERLIALGYLRGAADGVMGPQTRAALALATGVALGATNPVSRRLDPSSRTAKRLWAPAMPAWVRIHPDNDGHDWGTSFARDVIERAEATFDAIREPGYRKDLPLGDLSLIDGPTPDHQSHGTGFDLDMRLLQGDGYTMGSTIADGHTDANAAVLAAILTQPEVKRVLVDWRHSAFRRRVRFYLERAGTPEAINKVVNEPSNHHHHLHIDFVYAPFDHSLR